MTTWTFQHTWQENDPTHNTRETLKTLTRVYLFADKAALENDFESWLIDFESRTLWFGNQEARTYQRLPFPASLECPSRESLTQTHTCRLRTHAAAAQAELRCENPQAFFSFQGSRQAPPRHLIEVLRITELLADTPACILRHWPIGFETLQTREEHDGTTTELRLKLQSEQHNQEQSSERFSRKAGWRTLD